jgi:hypothetical protein
MSFDVDAFKERVSTSQAADLRRLGDEIVASQMDPATIARALTEAWSAGFALASREAAGYFAADREPGSPTG